MKNWFPALVWATMAVVATTLGLAALLGSSSGLVGDGVRFVPSSSVRLWLDPETGCEYFSESWRPRLDRDGKQICSAEGVSK